MQIDQLMQLMNVNGLNGLQGTSQSLSGSGLDSTSSMFQTLLESAITNMASQNANSNQQDGSSVNSTGQTGSGIMSIQPEKINQMIQLMLMESMMSGSSISSDSDSVGGSSSSGNMTQILEIMLLSMMNNQQNQGVSNIESSSNAANQSVSSDSDTQVNPAASSSAKIGKIANKDIENAIENASQKYGVDKDFIKAVIKQESGFHADAVSSAGAIGLMQLMPGTARSLGVNPYNPVENVDGGTKYLRNLLNAFDGNEKLALAAYNGGIGRMNRLGVDTAEEISKMPKETRNYVANVIKIYEANKNV